MRVSSTCLGVTLGLLGAGCFEAPSELVAAEACRLAERCPVDGWVGDFAECTSWFEVEPLLCTGSVERQRACQRELQLGVCAPDGSWPDACEQACALGSVVQVEPVPRTPCQDQVMSASYPPSPRVDVCVDVEVEVCMLFPPEDCIGVGLVSIDLAGRQVQAVGDLQIIGILGEPGAPPQQEVPLAGSTGELDLIIGTEALPYLALVNIGHTDVEDRVSVVVRARYLSLDDLP